MSDLELLLRDVRPVPSPQWTAKLDARVAAGFPGPLPRHRKFLRGVRDHLAALTLATATAGAVALVLIVGVNLASHAGGDDDSAGGAGGSTAVQEMKAASPDAGATSGGASSAAPLTDSRAVLKNASITLTASPGQVQDVSDRAIRAIDALGGYVQSSSIDTSGSRATASLMLRVPSAKLDDALTQLSKLGHVSSRSQQTEDMTDQRAALEARVRDLRADRDGLRERLAKATTDKQRDRLRALLDRASRRVTRAQRDVAQLGRSVAYATIDLSIEGRKASGGAAPGDRWTPGDALGDAGRVLEVIAGVLLIGLAILLPIAILVALAMGAGRVVTHRRRERALEAS